MTIQALTAEATRIARELRARSPFGSGLADLATDAELLAANMVCYAATVPVIEQDNGEGEG